MNNKFKTITTLLALAGLLVGCGSSGSSSKNTKAGYKGVFVDSPVAGVSYSCGGAAGTTDANGVFGVCPFGSSVTLSIGNVELGTVPPTSDNIFTPQDLVGVDRETTNNEKVNIMASLLLSLDSDPSTPGISITPEIVTAFEVAVPTATPIAEMNEEKIETAVEVTNEALPEEIKAEIHLEVVPVEEAAAHLVETAAAIDAGVIIAPEQPVILDDSTN